MLRAAPGDESARGLSHSIEKQTERPWAGGFVDVVTASAPTPEVTARLNLRGPPGIVSAKDVKTVRPTVEEIHKGIPEVIKQWRDTFGV